MKKAQQSKKHVSKKSYQVDAEPVFLPIMALWGLGNSYGRRRAYGGMGGGYGAPYGGYGGYGYGAGFGGGYPFGGGFGGYGGYGGGFRGPYGVRPGFGRGFYY